MWIRLGSFAVKPGHAEALRATYNAHAVPRVRACAGNLACLLLEPVADGEPFVAVTIWGSRAHGEAYDASGTAAEVVALAREHFAGPPTLRSYQSSSDAGLPAGADGA
jgi:heme-degrading monooxygenase HmoA